MSAVVRTDATSLRAPVPRKESDLARTGHVGAARAYHRDIADLAVRRRAYDTCLPYLPKSMFTE